MSPATNWIAPTTATSIAGTGMIAWENVSNAQGTVTGTWSRVAMLNTTNPQELSLTGYSFGVPSGRTVTGVEVQLRKSMVQQSADADAEISDGVVRIIVNTISGSNLASASIYPTFVHAGLTNFDGNVFTTTYGGKRERWGLSIPQLDRATIDTLTLRFAPTIIANKTVTTYVGLDTALARVWYSDGAPSVVVV